MIFIPNENQTIYKILKNIGFNTHANTQKTYKLSAYENEYKVLERKEYALIESNNTITKLSTNIFSTIKPSKEYEIFVEKFVYEHNTVNKSHYDDFIFIEKSKSDLCLLIGLLRCNDKNIGIVVHYEKELLFVLEELLAPIMDNSVRFDDVKSFETGVFQCLRHLDAKT
ncbi:hypothetical protein EDEG_02563 [Edhazardia aedis USNM 41457]|uniref:Uncharacterized protein n=1 Tax=Edhazardia aedis (strain USNM 41457) TaxID=1003232 RepID=J9D6A4_EDHAE|nr:hypothetical protein EDEG_02563 [Edhazardia aedis USNM 41457]|eukprot:EJW03044.1 hypothetical protein EDEG_02563 [Edhazardia aedis USNM 41457]